MRFDNRDIGLSTHLHDAAVPDIARAIAGDHSTAAYTLSDMAADSIGLIDALKIKTAHVVGASMGGVSVPAMAIEYAERLRSLTSIMSTTGDPSVSGSTEASMGVLFGPPATDRESAIERAIEAARVIGSPGFEFDEAAAESARLLPSIARLTLWGWRASLPRSWPAVAVRRN